MPKAADDILVQVGVDLPKLNSDLTNAEKRADKTASKLRRIFTLSDSSLGGRQAWLGGLSVVGGMLALGRGLNNYMDGQRAGYGEMGDFADALMRAIPVLNNFYELGVKLSEGVNMDERYADARMLRERLALETASLSGDPQQVLDAKKAMGRAAAQAEYMETLKEIAQKFPVPDLIADTIKTRTGKGGELAVDELVKGNASEVANAQALRNRMEGYARELMQAQLAATDRMTLDEKKKEVQKQADFFDSVSTVFGQFKVPRQDADKISQIEKNTEQAAKLLTDIKSFLKMLGNVGRPFN